MTSKSLSSWRAPTERVHDTRAMIYRRIEDTTEKSDVILENAIRRLFQEILVTMDAGTAFTDACLLRLVDENGMVFDWVLQEIDSGIGMHLAGGPMTTIIPGQRIAVIEVGDSPVELADPQTGDGFILVRANLYRKLLEEVEDHREHEAWGKAARKARDQWTSENPY